MRCIGILVRVSVETAHQLQRRFGHFEFGRGGVSDWAAERSCRQAVEKWAEGWERGGEEGHEPGGATHT